MCGACRFPGGSATLITNLETSIPAGAKKFPKLYQIAVHPLQPHILAVGSNTGIAALSLLDHAILANMNR